MTLSSYNRYRFETDPTERRDMEAFQEFLEEMLGPLLDNDANDNNFLREISLTTTETVVRHQLGRQLLGWKLIRKDANADVWESQAPDEAFLYLQATADVTVSIEVF